MGLTGQNNVTYSYNAADYLTSLTNANSETTSWTYNDVGLPTRQDSANSTYAQWTYDANRYWLTEVHNKKSDASTISRFQYTRDSVGNPTAMTETNATLGAQSPWSYTCTYDNVYQLTGETKKDKDVNTVYTISYEYDAAGNRTKKTEDGNETNYTYDDFNKMTAAGSTTFGYDNNGNMTSKTENSQTTSYSYNYENHMTGITYPDQSTNSFGYYGIGQRAWKVDSAGTSRFVYDGDEYGAPILAEVGGGGDYIATYTHGVHGLVSQRRGSTTNWYHYDDLGSTRNLTNSSQTITDAYTYKAFGEIPASSGSTTNPFRYIGALNYYGDADSSLLMLGARYYAPQWGRFTAVDPLRDHGNWYAYARSAPAGRTDRRGLAYDIDKCRGILELCMHAVKMFYEECIENDRARRWTVGFTLLAAGVAIPLAPFAAIPSLSIGGVTFNMAAGTATVVKGGLVIGGAAYATARSDRAQWCSDIAEMLRWRCVNEFHWCEYQAGWRPPAPRKPDILWWSYQAGYWSGYLDALRRREVAPNAPLAE